MVCRDMGCLGSPGIAGPRAFPKQDYSAAAAGRKQSRARLNVIVQPETGVGIEESERLSFEIRNVAGQTRCTRAYGQSQTTQHHSRLRRRWSRPYPSMPKACQPLSLFRLSARCYKRYAYI